MEAQWMSIIQCYWWIWGIYQICYYYIRMCHIAYSRSVDIYIIYSSDQRLPLEMNYIFEYFCYGTLGEKILRILKYLHIWISLPSDWLIISNAQISPHYNLKLFLSSIGQLLNIPYFSWLKCQELVIQHLGFI